MRGVIFDLFHTLTGPYSVAKGWPTTNEVLGIDPTRWNAAIAKDSRARLTGALRDPAEIVRSVAHRLDPNIPLELITRAADARIALAQRVLQAIPNPSIETLNSLRSHGLKLGLISNLDCCECVGWTSSPLRGLFDVELFSCEVGMAKPEPGIYRECLTRLGLSAAECMYVGDGGGNELGGAREVGLFTVLFTGVIQDLWPERIPSLAQSADARVDSMPDMLALAGVKASASPKSALP
ncbi:MAG: HAD hydrolase-like protein [Burkholderiales bacterium]